MGKTLRVSEHYFGDRGKRYFEGGFRDDTKFGRLFQSRYFRPFCSNDLILLDFGCADGFFLRCLPARKRIGVEANSTAREKCIQLCEKESISIDLYSSLAAVKSMSADIVISNHCLEHTPSPLENLEHIKRILKPKGMFLLVVPFDDWRNKKHRTWVRDDKDNHLYTWSPMNLGNLLVEAGFEVEFSIVCTSAWSPKLYWIYDLMGERFFKSACYLLSLFKNRREVFCKARRGAM